MLTLFNCDIKGTEKCPHMIDSGVESTEAPIQLRYSSSAGLTDTDNRLSLPGRYLTWGLLFFDFTP